MNRWLAVDIGGTKVALALADERSILARVRYDAEADRGPDFMIDRALAEARQLLAKLPGTLMAAGISCGGPLDRRSGVVRNPPNLPGWTEVALASRIAGGLGTRAALDNDAKLAALGEHRLGAARGFRRFVYLTVSTGIGGGLVLDGELQYGLGDAAGEVGHQTLMADGPLCGCGNRGCLEALASGTAIGRAAREAARADPVAAQPLLRFAGGDSARLSAGLVAQAAVAGDPLARALWGRAMNMLGVGIGNLVTILAPEAIVIGGGLSAAGAALFDPVRAVVRERVRLLPAASVAIVPAELGTESSLHGALALARSLA
jgi:glucokinase